MLELLFQAFVHSSQDQRTSAEHSLINPYLQRTSVGSAEWDLQTPRLCLSNFINVSSKLKTRAYGLAFQSNYNERRLPEGIRGFLYFASV
jgi:hypothetical protein